MDEQPSRGDGKRAAASSSGAAPLTAADVSRYFSRRFGAPVLIRNMRQTFPGLSRVTWLVQAEIAGERQDFALRVDPPGGGLGFHPLRTEWEIYRRLWNTCIPVPEPLWFDEDVEFADGRPHMVRRLVDGKMSVDRLSEQSAEGALIRKRVAFEHAERLARLHTLDWRALHFEELFQAPNDAPDALHAEFRIWRERWNREKPAGYAVIEEALCWLEEQLPRDPPRISLLKGNNGLGEEIWRGERIVAMCDWELASLSDGTLDLAFSQGTLGLHDYAETLRHYESIVGHEVPAHRLAAGAFVTWFKMLVCGVVGMHNRFVRGDPRIQLLSAGLVYTKGTEHKLARCIGKDLVEAWQKIANEDKSYYVSARGTK
jgi:aminoglycoside phosphotransferase (APT) family kinase protein